MDCNEAREKINMFIDGQLDDAEKQRLIWHASSCTQCKKELDDAIRLKQALAGLKEVEPPAGIVASAIKKAKRRRFPVYAYASVVAAAVIALLLIFSPPMLSQRSPTADNAAAPELMYSAADANTEADGKAAAGCAASEEAAVAEAQEIQSELGVEMPQMSAEASRETIVDSPHIFVYQSEEELFNALQSGADGMRGLAQYFRPAAPPEGAVLQQIEVSGASVRWVYSLSEGSAIVFEWLRTRTAEELQGWSEQTQVLSDNLAHSFVHNGDVFWSGEARFNDCGKMEATDGTVIHAYWTQDGAVFHAELPTGLTDEEIFAFCAAEAVPAE